MDSHQKSNEDNYSILTLNQPMISLSTTSSDVSILRTTSLTKSKLSSINEDHSMTQNRFYHQQKQLEHNISSSSSLSNSSTEILEKQNVSIQNFSNFNRKEARPLGTCVRKCSQCRQLKHILLAECTACFRMMDIDLKDCKCQIFMNRNVIEHFNCSICNTQLTLDGYIICANRTCQTLLSRLINEESNNEIQTKSILFDIITNITYPNSMHRTVAVQVHTLMKLPPLQRFLSTTIDRENEKTSSISTQSSDTYHTNNNNNNIVDISLNKITMNMIPAYNSNQPSKFTYESGNESRHDQKQQVSHLIDIQKITSKNDLESNETPKSPRCLAIMNAHKRRDRLSKLLPLRTNRRCQTHLSCLTNIDKVFRIEEVSSTTVIRTNNPNRIERQIQVDTIKEDFGEVYIEIVDCAEKDSTISGMDDERVFKALTDTDDQRWSELIVQLINEPSQLSLSEIAQQLLDTIERLHTNKRLDTLTNGQLQHKIRYAMSQFKSFDENLYRQHNRKTSDRTSKKSTDCNSRVDMAVTVRQIDQRHNRSSSVTTHQNWKRYVDRLFEQGHSSDEIQQLLYEAARTTMPNDDQRLQNVFNYIDTKAKEDRLKRAPTGIEFISSRVKSTLEINSQLQPVDLIQNKEIIDISIQNEKVFDENHAAEKREIAPLNGASSLHKLKKSLPFVTTDYDQANSILPTNLKQQDVHSHSLNIETEIDELITCFESKMKESNSMDCDKIEYLMKRYIELLNNEKRSIESSTNESHTQELNEKLNSENVILNQTNSNKSESFENKQISQSQSTHSSTNKPLDVKSESILTENQENARLIRCHPVPYMSSKEKISTETLQQVFIESKEQISLKTKDFKENLDTNERIDEEDVTIISSQIDSTINNSQSQTKWLNSLLSKISNSPSNITDTVSTSPSLSVINQTNSDHNDRMNIVEKPNRLDQTDRIVFEKEHVQSIIVPIYNLPILQDQYHIVKIQILQRTSVTTTSKQMKESQDQFTSIHDDKMNSNIKNEDSHSNNDINSTPLSPPVTTVHTNRSDEEKSSISSFIDQSLSFEPIASEQVSNNEENIESSRQLFEIEKGITISPVLTSNDIMTAEANTHTDQLLNGNVSISNIVMRKNEVYTHFEEPFQFQKRTNPILLPALVQQVTVPNMINTHSSFIHLNNQNDMNLSQESITNNDSMMNAQKNSAISSNYQNMIPISTQNNEDYQSGNEKIDHRDTDDTLEPLILSMTHRIVQQSTNTILSPSDTPKTINSKYKKLSTPSPNTFEPLSTPDQLFEDDKSLMKHNITPNLSIEDQSEQTTLPIESSTMNERIDDSKFYESNLPNDDTSKEDISNKLQNEYSASPSSKNSLQGSILSDNILENPVVEVETDDEQMKAQLSRSNRYSRPKLSVEDVQTPFYTTPQSSVTSTSSVDNTHIEQQQHEEETQPTVGDITSSLTLLNQSEPSNETSTSDPQKIKSSSSKNINTRESNKSAKIENISPYHHSKQRHHNREHELERIKSLRNNSIAQIEAIVDDNHAENENIKHSNQNDEYDYKQKSKRVDSSSTIKKHSIMSTTTTINLGMQEPSLKLQNSTLKNENDKLMFDDILVESSEETQRTTSITSFNPDHLNNFISNEFYKEKDQRSFIRKGQSSLPTKSNRTMIPLSSIPKMLSKRSPRKQISTTLQSTKPNTILSVTDVSTSSNNTLATDQLLSTQSTITAHKKITSLKKSSKTYRSKERNTKTPNSNSKHKIFRRTTSRSSTNFTLPNSTERHIATSKKKIKDRNLLMHSDLIYTTEPSSDAWIQSHEDTSEILIIDERNDKKQHKNKMLEESHLMPINLKARGDHQAHTIDSSKLPSIEQSCGENHMKKLSNNIVRRPMIRLPVTQIEKFDCGTIGPRLHPSSLTRQLLYLPSIRVHEHDHQTNETLTDRLYRLMSSETNDDKCAFESIVNWQQQSYQLTKTEQNKFQYMYLLDLPTRGNTIRGRQYPILTDEIDLIDDLNTCTLVNKWAFADLVDIERKKYFQESIPVKQSNLNKSIKICLRKRPLTQFEQNVFKEVDIISTIDSQTILLHIPSITVDNQVFIKNQKFKCDQTFDEHCQINTVYQATLSPLLDKVLDGNKCLYLIGGGRYSGKTSLLRSLIDLLAFDLIQLLSSYDIYIKFLGICHNRIVDLLQNYSPIRLMKLINWIFIPDEEFHLKTDQDIDYIVCQMKKRRRYMHQLIQINFYEKGQSTVIGSLMIVLLASSQYVYTRNLCSHRRKFLINSLNKTMLSFKRALLGIRQHPDRIRAAFNNDILTRLIQPYVFNEPSNVCYIGTLNPGHRHRIATKSTLEFARNLRFCLKHIHRQRRKHKKLFQIKNFNDDDDNEIF